MADSRETSVGEKATYGLGEICSTMAWNLVTGFIVYYYTDVAIIPVGVVATIMLVTRILDAIFDPLAGVLIDRTNTRLGRTKPYVLGMSVPFAVLLVLTFAVPDWSAQAKIAWAVATFTLFGLSFSFLHVPFAALMAMMSVSVRDKLQLSSVKSAATSIGSIAIYGAALPAVHLLGGGNDRQGFAMVAVGAGIVSIIGMIPVFFFCHERNAPHLGPVERADEGSGLRLAQNLTWIIASAYGFLLFLRIGVAVASTAYFAKSVLGNVNLASVLLPLLSVAILTGGIVAAELVRRFGLVLANTIGLAFSAFVYAFLPLIEHNPVLFGAGFFIANIPVGLNTASLYILIVEAVERQQETTGVRREGLISSSVSFSQKVGMALGASLVAYGLSLAGYRPQLHGSAKAAISIIFFALPAAIALLQLALIRTLRSTVV